MSSDDSGTAGCSIACCGVCTFKAQIKLKVSIVVTRQEVQKSTACWWVTFKYSENSFRKRGQTSTRFPNVTPTQLCRAFAPPEALLLLHFHLPPVAEKSCNVFRLGFMRFHVDIPLMQVYRRNIEFKKNGSSRWGGVSGTLFRLQGGSHQSIQTLRANN